MINRVSYPQGAREITPDQLRLRAETYCVRAEHCADEVRNKILQWGGDVRTAERIIDGLYDDNFLNDLRYCQAYVHDKLLYQHWGKVKIRMMLQAHRLPADCIAAAMGEINDAEYMDILRRTLSQKQSAPRDSQIRFLLQRGFEYKDILTVLE